MVFPASSVFTVINLCFAGIVEAKPMQDDKGALNDEIGHLGNVLAQLSGKDTIAFHVVEQQQDSGLEANGNSQQQHRHHQQQEEQQEEDPQGLVQRGEEHVQFGGQGGEFQAGDVEELVHGHRNVHGRGTEEDGERREEERAQVLAASVEELMHGGADVHGGGAGASTSEGAQGADDPKGEFKAGDAEEIVHGESHVHGLDAAATNLPYGPGADVETLVHGPASRKHINVHDPAARHEAARTLALVADVDALMGTGGGSHDAERKRQRGNAPTVVDGEHLMHGGGGHDHDVRQLKFVKSKEEEQDEKEASRKARDPFADVHGLLMHGDGRHDDDEEVRRGKVITYEDIMALGLDESMLKGVDLKQLLLRDAREYDAWQRDKNAAPGEQPEASWWDQIKDLRKRYLPPFAGGEDKPRDLTGTRLDPENQKWVAGKGVDDDDDESGSEDHVLHQLEILGNTAPLKDRHKHARKKFVENGRDLTDL